MSRYRGRMTQQNADVPSLRWGLLAAGNIAATFAAGVSHCRLGSLAAVASRSLEKAQAFADKNGVPRAHGSYEELLADPDVDAVYVSTPHPQHAEWAIKALRAGKHVLCEKPLGVSAAEVAAMFDEAEANGRVLLEAFMYRNSPLTARLDALVREGTVGEVRLIEASFSFRSEAPPEHRLYSNDLAGGGIMDVGCYCVSAARLLAGAASGKPFAEPTGVSGAAHLGQTGVDEWAVGTMKFDGGVVAQLRTGVRLAAHNGVTVHGSKGRIEVGGDVWVPMKQGGGATIRVTLGKDDVREERVETDQWLFGLEADAFARAVHNGGEPPHPAMNAADSLGNAVALDAWRKAVGLRYGFESAEKFPKTTLAGETLKKRDDAAMTYGKVAGVDKPVSRLVMGVDNQSTLPGAAALFDDYFERGGNAFDNAFVYEGGRCEATLGDWLKVRGVRDECVLIAKGAHTPYDRPAFVGVQLGISLDRLGVDHVELYCPHRDNEGVPVGEWADALHELVTSGRARAVGVSNWSLDRARAFDEYARKNGRTTLSAVSNNLSLARAIDVPWKGCRSFHETNDDYAAWRDYLTQSGVASLAWSSQARGYFVPGRDLEEAELKRCWVSDDNAERRRRAFDLAEKKGVAPINVAAAWVLAQPFESFALIGPRRPGETRSSMAALSVQLSDAEVRWLNLEAESLG